MALAGELMVRIGVDLANFKKGMKEAVDAIQANMKKAEAGSKILLGGIAALGTAAAGFSVKAITMAGAMEQSQVAFTTMLGSAERATALMKELQKFGAETPFEFPEIQASAKSLLAFGVNAGEVTETLRRIGDIASGVGAPLNEIAQLYGKAKTQGRLFAEDINQLTGRGIPIIKELASQFGVSESEVRKLVESGKIGFPQLELAFKNLTATGSQFGGMMEAQSKTLPGMWSNLMDNIGQSAVIVGQELIESFDIKERLAGVIDSLGKISAVLQAEGLQGAIDKLFSEKTRLAIVGIAGAIVGALVPGLWAAARAAIAAAVPLLPWIALGAAIAAIAYVIYNAWANNMFGIRDKVVAVTATISAVWNAMIIGLQMGATQWYQWMQQLILAMMNFIQPLVNVIGAVVPSVKNMFSTARAQIETNVNNASSRLQQLGTDAQGAAKQLQNATDSVKTSFSSWSTPAESVKVPKVEIPKLPSLGSALSEAQPDIAGTTTEVKKYIGTIDELNDGLSLLKSRHETAMVYAEMHSSKTEVLQQKQKLLTEELTVQKEIVARMTTAVEENTAAGQMQNETADEYAKRMADMKKTVADTVKGQADLEKQLYDTTQALKEEAKAAQKTRDDLADLGKQVTDLREKYNDELITALENYQTKVEDVNKKLAQSEADLTAKYESELTNRTDALANFVGLFNAVKPTEGVTSAGLLGNLQGQVDQMRQWSDSIQKLAARGVDAGLLAELRKAGPQAAAEVQAISDMTDPQLQNYVNLWQQRYNLARTAAVTELEGLRLETEQKIVQLRLDAQVQLEAYRTEWVKKNAEIRKNTEEELKKIADKYNEMVDNSTIQGQQFVLNFANGMESQFSTLLDTITRMGTILEFAGGTATITSTAAANVPHLAKGGIVTRPTLALIGEGGRPEGVFPLDGSNRAGNTANFGDIYITAYDPEDIWSQLRRKLVRSGLRLNV